MKVKQLFKKKGRCFVLLFLLLGAVGMTKMYAYDFSSVCSTGQTLYYNITDATNHYVALVAPGGNSYSAWSGFTRPTGNIILPGSVQNDGITYTVTTIGDYAFYYCRGLTGSLTIPSSVTSIGGYSFINCTGFTGNLVIGNSVTLIGNCAFYGCSGFTGSLTIPNSMTSIGGDAFSDCSGFTGSLTIPNSVTSIGGGAFSGCSGFTGSLTIGNSVTSIGNYAFNNCSGFTGSLTIGNSVTSIAYNAFYNCSGFTDVFYNATNYPDTNIYESPFKDCSGTLVIGNNVERIPSGMFSQACFTGSLTIPNSVTWIGRSAFSGCNGFTGSLTIPNSVTSIGNYAFSGCSGFTGSLIIGNSVTSIGGYAFYNCSGFTGSLTIGNSVTSIGEQAFSGCSGLTGSLTIGNSVTSIGNSAFSGCNGFTGSLTIPNSVTSIGNSAFSGCNGFTGSLTIPNSVTSIDNSAFSGCSGLTGSLTIGNSVTSIGNYAFSGCSGFTGSLSIGNSVTSIGYYAFYNCSGFTGGLTIPNSVTSIGYNAFYNCSGFTGSLSIGNSVTSIGNYAFYNCSGFTGSLIIPNSMTSISNYVFSGCSGLTGSLTIPNSVTTIGNSAFSGCSHISVIISFAETPPSCGNNAFGSWITSSIVYVPCSFSEAYSSISWGGFNNFYGLCQGTVTVVADPENGGTVSGGGTFEGGVQRTVTATANDGYTFEHWELDDVWVSSEVEYTFVVGGDMVLTAHFVLDDNIIFADANVKSICIAHWDTNGDGELSYEEAASVTSLGNYFRNNTQISSFKELLYFVGLSSIGSYEFYGCSNLGCLAIPTSVTSIGNSAFNGCSGLTGVYYTGSIGQWCNISFGNNYSNNNPLSYAHNLYIDNELVTDLVIPEGLTEIKHAFSGATCLTSLTIPTSVTSIGNSAFSGCSGLTGVYYTGSIGQWCNISFGDYYSSNNNPLSYAHNLYIDNELVTDLVIPEGPTEIKNFAFSGATCLTSLTIPNSVTSIGRNAFSGCSGLTGSLTIPNSVTWIGSSAFSGCSGFTGSLTIPNSVTSIGESAFSGCSGFTGSLTISNSVTTIGSSAFSGCSGFTGGLTIGNSVTSIGYNAFYNCSGFTGSLTIPNSVTSIDEYAFHNCSSLTGSLTIGNSVTWIGSAAFYGCSGFTGVYYTGDISQWCNISYGTYNSEGNNPLFYVHNLYIDNVLVTDLVIPDNVTEIKDYAFEGATCLTSLTLPNSVTWIGQNAFSGCSGLTGDLVIPNSVTEIGWGAFSGCSGFTGNLTIGNSMETLDLTYFEDCNFTGRLTIGNSVTTIYDINYGWEYKQSRQNWGFTEIHSKNTTPPVFSTEYPYYGKSEKSEYEVLNGVSRSIPVYVPCGATEAYSNADVWSEFTNYQEIPASLIVKPNFEHLGYIEIVQYGTCDNPESIVEAYPNYSDWTNQSYEFINWTVDGEVVSTNPYYTFNLTEDITLVANFGPGSNHVFVGGNSSQWSDAENWLPQELPTDASTVDILANVYVNGEAIASNVNLPEGISMTIMPEGVLTVTGSLNSSSSWYWWGGEPSVVIEDGGQLYHSNEYVTAMVKKTIVSYTPGQKNGWHLIAHPMVNEVYVYDVENLSNNEYDLYYYDEPTVYWINQENAENDFTWLETGKGYLYANNQNVNLGFSGELQSGTAEVNVPLDYTADHALQGFNLVGNPFAHNVTSYASENVANGCYRMNDAKDNLIVSEISEANPLKPTEGFFVKATGENASLTFNQSRGPNASQSGSIRVELLDNGKLIDRLIVKKDGKMLEKLSLNEQRTKIFAFKDQQEVSIVSCEGNEQPISFKTTKEGSYTINVNTVNLRLNYLHLIDKLNGADVDLLANPTYTFKANPTDYVSRFCLVFSICENSENRH